MSVEDEYWGVLDPEVVATWLASTGLSDNTKEAYEVGFRTWCQYVAENGLDFDDLEEQDVIDFKEHLTRDRDFAPASTSRYLSAIRSFYRFAEARGLDNIARNVKGAKTGRDHKRSALSAEQARDMIASYGDPPGSIADLRDRAIVSLMLHTGMRDVEVVRANIGDRTTTGGYEVLQVWGKGHDSADAVVKITPALDRQIREYLKTRKGAKPEDPMFASLSNRNRGGRLTTRSVSAIFKRGLRRIGIDDPRYTAHSARHTAGTLSLAAGARIEDVQAMLRHAEITTTMVYAHHVKRLENAAEDVVAEILDD